MIKNLDAAIRESEHGGYISLPPGVFWVKNGQCFERSELSAEDINLISTIIQARPIIYELRLSNCILGNLHGSLTALLTSCNIKNIHFTVIDLNAPFLIELVQALKQNTSLENIYFTYVNVSSVHDMQILGEALRGNTTLKKVDFLDTNFSQHAVRILIKTAIMQRLEQWSDFIINQNKPVLNLKNTALLALVTNNDYIHDTFHPMIIDLHSIELRKMLSNYRVYYKSVYLEITKLLYKLHYVSNPQNQPDSPITHKSLRYNFLSMFTTKSKIKEPGEALPINKIFLPTEITRHIISFLPKPHYMNLPKSKDILDNMKHKRFGI